MGALSRRYNNPSGEKYRLEKFSMIIFSFQILLWSYQRLKSWKYELKISFATHNDAIHRNIIVRCTDYCSYVNFLNNYKFISRPH